MDDADVDALRSQSFTAIVAWLKRDWVTFHAILDSGDADTTEVRVPQGMRSPGVRRAIKVLGTGRSQGRT
jgi:hypothetical protein